jgi:nucleotide-binding universal stress UspA family protein
MFKRILVPVDGSARSEHAAYAAIELASFLRAKIVALYVYPSLEAAQMDPFTVRPSTLSAAAFREQQRLGAMSALAIVERAAEKLNVPIKTMAVESESVARTIVATAVSASLPCDLVFIGSHGRSVIAQSILGSVTTKVQAMCEVPVLVYRDGKKSAKRASVISPNTPVIAAAGLAKKATKVAAKANPKPKSKTATKTATKTRRVV